MSREFQKELRLNEDALFFMDQKSFLVPQNIISLLAGVFGKGSEPILVYIGKQYGRNLIERIEDKFTPKSRTAITSSFFKMLEYSGFGHFKYTSENENLITIINVRNSNNSGMNEESFCYLLKGIISGYGEYVLYNCSVSEISCSSKKKDKSDCTFLIQSK